MEGADHVTKVVSYDGQTIWMEGRVALYEVGNFLGGGAAGTVYEAENSKTKEHFALKILNPLGYKLLSPALLRRCAVLSKGKPVSEAAEKSKEPLTVDHVWWLHNVSTKQYLAAFYSERQRTLNELSLVQCMNIWGTNPSDTSNCTSSGDFAKVNSGPGVSRPPTLPPKYADFVRRRGRIFREIRNMRNISSHVNVIRLENVLELAQDSKCTIFLVMELANGGELFDRIKIDCGTREKTAKKFFLQLLSGVRHCHDEGVCHRDLKPENLLLQDFSSTPDGSMLKIADFGFSARMAMAEHEEVGWEFRTSPPSGGILAGSPLRILRSVVGSPFYVAPEVLQAEGYDGRKADAWSIGVILYAMLAGNLPFSQELSTCKRFKQFGLWAAEMTSKNPRFWEDPSLQCPPWLFSSKFSPLARSLIVAMLLPDPAARLSVHECQEHRWCQCENESDAETRKGPSPTERPDNSTCQPSALGAALAAPLSLSPVMAEVSLTAPVSVAQAVIRETHTVPLAPIPSAPPALLDDMEENDFADDDDDDDDREDHDMMEEEQQFVMDDFSDDETEHRQGVVTKKSKKSPDSYLYDSASGLSSGSSGLGDVSQSLFGEGVGMLAGGPPGDTTSTGVEYAFRRVSVTENTKPVSSPVPPRSPYSTGRDRAKGLVDRPVATGTTVNLHRRSFTTPPPIPTNAVPYIVAGTPDLIGETGAEDWMGMPPYGYSPQDFEHLPNGSRFATDSLGCSMSRTAAYSCVEEQQHMHQQHMHPPSFHDAVKRSTRFITSVPAAEVLEKVESILEQCRVHRTSSPIGLIGRVEVHWESYHLDVWGVHEIASGNPPLCSLHLYQLPSSTPPMSPAREVSGGVSSGCNPLKLGSSFGPAPSVPQQLYLVEFVRGQLEIFQFKRFYEWVRQKVSELVKRDYAFNCFDQAGSPIVVSTLADSPRIPGGSMHAHRHAGVSS